LYIFGKKLMVIIYARKFINLYCAENSIQD
jgi:hypothetical protein